MSLDWSIREVDNWKDLADNEFEQVVTQSIVFMTMAVGIGEITESTVDEFTHRAVTVQALSGPFMYAKGEPFYITRAHIQRRIGLHTNVGHETRRDWEKRTLAFSGDLERRQQYANDKVESRIVEEVDA